MGNRLQFRKDINGLRALAVISVVLFHFDATILPGGFAGVDVFFVISGFLMTQIISREVGEGNFSITRFYISRFKRIFPALAVLCCVVSIFGFFYLTPLDSQKLITHAGSSLAFLSNFFYLHEVGYFDATSHEKWLLHTWSLSVEWQFYLILPLILIFMYRFMLLATIKHCVVIATILGFIFCVIATYNWQNFSYYLLPTRAWEMLIGAVAYFYPVVLKEKNKRLLAWLGILLIIGSCFFVSQKTPWPGYLAILPILGTLFVIQAQYQSGFLNQNILIQKIGTWSYSIYLWHWPIVVLFYFEGIDSLFLGIFLSITLGFVSFNLIEKINIKLYPIGISLLSVPFLFAIIYDNKNLEEARLYDEEKEAYLYEYSNPKCNFRPYDPVLRKQIERTQIIEPCYKTKNASILLHGDSHSQHFFHGLKKHFNDAFDILQISAFSCRLVVTNATPGCKASNKLFNNEIKNIAPNILILSVRNGLEDVDWANYLIQLDNIGKILILGPSPEYNFFEMKYKGRSEVVNWDYMQKTDSYMEGQIDQLNVKFNNIKYISMRELLCPQGINSCLKEVDDKKISADGGHFSRAGSIKVVDLLKEHIN